MLKKIIDHIFYPLRDPQNRLRVGCLAWSGGIEKTQEELSSQSHRFFTRTEIESCLKEYTEWLKSVEAQRLKKDWLNSEEC